MVVDWFSGSAFRFEALWGIGAGPVRTVRQQRGGSPLPVLPE